MIKLKRNDFSDSFLKSFSQAAEEIFGDDLDEQWLSSLEWKLKNMPDAQVDYICNQGKIVAFKAGYAVSKYRFCSWLGGIIPLYRRQNYATKLMQSQHDRVHLLNYSSIVTIVAQNNRHMIALNSKFGFEVCGYKMKLGKPYFIMDKIF